MPAIAGPGIEIDGPRCEPMRFTLLDIAEVAEPEIHWETGFHHQQQSCDTITSRLLECVGDFDEHVPKITDGSGLSWPVGDPVTLIAPYTCSTFGQTLQDSYDFAEARLDQAEAREVERIFWSGTDSDGNGVRQTLGGSAGLLDDLGTASSIVGGVALLEEFMGGATACNATIHAPRVLAPYFDRDDLTVTYQDGVRRSNTLSRVVFGGGYARDLPPNFVAAPGEAYIAISGGVKILRSPTFFASAQDDPAAAIDRAVNDVTVYAERTYGFAMGCGVAVVKVPLA